MEKLEQYRKIVKEILQEVGTLGKRPDDIIKTQFIQDEEGGHYLLFSNGWREDNRVYGCYLHIDITEDGKVWLQHDGTDMVIAQELLDRGIPKEDIVLAFYAPFRREETGFAVA